MRRVLNNLANLARRIETPSFALTTKTEKHEHAGDFKAR